MNTAVHTESSRRVQDARHLSNPTRNERSECRVGYVSGARGCVSETHYYHQRRINIVLTGIMLLLAFSFMGCRNFSAQAEETNEIQITEHADTLANIPMTVK